MDIRRRDLERKRSTITRALQDNMRSTRERGALIGIESMKDPWGSASSAHDDELAAIAMGRLANDLKQIDQAIADLDAGRYGVCADCEKPIAAKRLKALPFASRCIECQSRSEQGLARAA